MSRTHDDGIEELDCEFNDLCQQADTLMYAQDEKIHECIRQMNEVNERFLARHGSKTLERRSHLHDGFARAQSQLNALKAQHNKLRTMQGVFNQMTELYANAVGGGDVQDVGVDNNLGDDFSLVSDNLN